MELDGREAELTRRESERTSELDGREAELTRRQAELDARATEYGEREEEMQRRHNQADDLRQEDQDRRNEDQTQRNEEADRRRRGRAQQAAQEFREWFDENEIERARAEQAGLTRRESELAQGEAALAAARFAERTTELDGREAEVAQTEAAERRELRDLAIPLFLLVFLHMVEIWANAIQPYVGGWSGDVAPWDRIGRCALFAGYLVFFSVYFFFPIMRIIGSK